VDESFEARLRGELAPDLEVVRLIGRGQMSSVYLAREVALRRPVAVKLLRSELSADAIACARFEREAQSAARITHPNVAAVQRVGRLHDGVPYLVMEYVDGRNLEDALVAEGALDEGATRRLLAQLGDALAAAHAQDVVHRDVRPANVLLERARDRVVLTDFGVAAVAVSGAEAVTRLTRDGEQIGDRRYMSPEQLLGRPVTAETDVYSLGIIGYEAFTRAQPFRAEGLSDPVTARLRQAPIALSTLRSDAPADLEDLLLRCLSMQPERRPRASEIARIVLGARSHGVAATTVPRTRGGNALGNFIDELKHRRVLGEALAYLAIAFAVLQGAQLALPALGFSERVFNTLVLVVLAGFPAFIAFAWAYDLRRGRAVATLDGNDPRGTRPRRWLAQALVLVLSLAIVVMLGWWYLR
jgi:tRNA A-37 threonylcarbamoyl transferase component Bud32